MAEKDLLLNAVRDSLMQSGHFGHFRAEIRSAVLSTLYTVNKHKKPQIPSETKVINELIREYLLWNGYKYTQDMLVAESGMQSEQPSREFLTTKLGVVDDNATESDDLNSSHNKIPLLYYLLHTFQSDT